MIAAGTLVEALSLLDRDALDENDESEQPCAYSAHAFAAELGVDEAMAQEVLTFLLCSGRVVRLKAHGVIVYARREDGDVSFGNKRVVPVLSAFDQVPDERTPSTGGWRYFPPTPRRAHQLGANLKRA